MTPRALPAVSLFAALAATLPAQHPAGLSLGMPPAEVALLMLSAPVGAELMLRVPGEAYRGLGRHAGAGRHRILGARLRLNDATLADGELFDVHAYLEDGATNRPTIRGFEPPGTSSVGSVLGITTPQGVGEQEVQVLFPAPIEVPAGSDLFVSVSLRSPGLRVRCIGGTGIAAFTTTLLDACGAGLDPHDAFAYLHDAGAVTPLGSGLVGWQPLIELLVEGASGVAVTRRAPSHPPTASMYSGLHPDSATPSHQPGRRDEPGYVFLANGAVAEGSPVFLLGSVLPFAQGPWIVLSPGDAVLHLLPVGLVGLGFATVDSGGQATVYWPVPQSAAVRGVDVRSQAFAFDPASGVVAAGAAVRQRF